MLTIAQASVLGQNQIKDGVIQMFAINSPLLQQISFLPVVGNAYQYNRELTLPTSGTRAVNATWVESTGTFESKTEALKIYGGEAHVDRFVQKTMAGSLGDHVAVQTELKVRATIGTVHNDFVNGDVAANALGIDGIKKRVITSQVLGGSTTGTLDVNLDSASRNTFMDLLDNLISSVRGGAGALLMNAAMINKIRSVARREGFHAADRNDFGQVVESYNGVPLIDIGKKNDGTEIIPSNEPNAAATPVNETTSIYAVGFGDDRLVGLTNGGIDSYEIGGGPDGEMETKPAFGVRIEWYLGLADHTDKSIARLRYVK